MGLLDDQLTDDMTNAFCDADVFAEPIIYTGDDGQQVEFNAPVNRYPIENIEGGPHGARQWHFIVTLPKSFVPVCKVGHGVTLPMRDGGSDTQDMTIQEIISQDGGAWTVRLA